MARTNNRQQSGLLHCLASLGGETFAAVLLPKLVEAGSAGAVVLTCSQLRDLCHGSVQQLDLTQALQQDSSEPAVLEEWMQSLPQHFNNCTSAQLRLHEEGSYHRLTYLLPGLARLPKLSSLTVTVEGSTLYVVPMSMALHCMRTQLLQLRSLDLQLKQSWRRTAHAWKELGSMTQLTSLAVRFAEKEVKHPVVATDVLPLKNLHNLQCLAITAADYQFLRPLLSAELAAGLTSLTQLQLGGWPVSALKHVSSCVALRSLYAACPVDAQQELGQAEWAAVGCLTGLTELQLWNAKFLSASPECCAAINSLSRLQVVAAEWWSAKLLPAFSSCIHLTRICGAWKPGGVAEGVTLPSVVSLSETAGSPPLAAFPHLTTIEHDAWLAVEAFADIPRHCMGLTELTVTGQRAENTSLPLDAAPSARIGAIKSLSALTRLTGLDFMPQDNAEVAVLVDVAASLLPLGLKRLDVLLLHDSQLLNAGALMQFAKLGGLQSLTLELLADRVVAAVREEADNLLMACSGIACVELYTPVETDAFKQIIWAAKARLLDLGLPCPRAIALRLTSLSDNSVT